MTAMPAQVIDAEAEPILRWYAVLSKAQEELWAASNLRRRGFEVFFPHQRSTRRIFKTRFVASIRPYMSRYLFVGLKGEEWPESQRQSLRTVRGTFGVAAVIRLGARDMMIPAKDIERLRSFVSDDGCTDPGSCSLHPPAPITRTLRHPGEAVRITAGPFAGHTAVVIIDTGTDVRIWLTVFGRSSEATIAPAALDDIEAVTVR